MSTKASLEQRAKYNYTPEELTWDNLKYGALQRIATALEGIESQLRYSNNRTQNSEKRIRSLEVRNRNLRKKLKEQK